MDYKFFLQLNKLIILQNKCLQCRKVMQEYNECPEIPKMVIILLKMNNNQVFK